MASRSNKSKSFMREHEFIGISNVCDEEDEGFYIDKDGVKKDATLDLDNVFRKKDNGYLMLQKKTLLKLTAEKGMNRNVVVNAINLQDYSLYQIKKIIKNLTEELKKNKVKGVLEFHANDTTQSSYHFHFWTWLHYETKARAVITDYIIEHNYANYSNVKIEGEFKKNIDKDSSKEIKKQVNEENIKSRINKEDLDKKTTLRVVTSLDRAKERFRILKNLEDTPVVKQEDIKNEIELKTIKDKEIPIKKEENIFNKILSGTRKTINLTKLRKENFENNKFNLEKELEELRLLRAKIKVKK